MKEIRRVVGHPIERVWDVIAEIADEGSIRGKISYRKGKEGTGGQFFTIDGEEFDVTIYRGPLEEESDD